MKYPDYKKAGGASYKKGGFKISGPCKSAARSKFDVYPSAYANAWGVRCTKKGGPSAMGKSKKQEGGPLQPMKKKKAGQDHRDGARRVGAYKKGSSNPRKEFKRVSNAEQHRQTSGSKSGKPRLAQKLKRKGGFPDLTGDGKVTRADILKGRGVIKQKGGMKKCRYGC
tara:strand:+ start:2797 stop:3300 length:504 start_codon:yes stop_codon:yes gene_type:complete